MVTKISLKEKLKRKTLGEIIIIFLFFFFLFWSDLRNEELTLFLAERSQKLYIESGFALSFSLFLFSQIGLHYSFIFLLFPIIFWIEEKEVGKRAALGLFLVGGVTFVIRHLTALPRPYFPELEGLSKKDGYSFPSGHITQLVMVIGVLANYYKKRIIWILLFLIISLVGVSRLFFGHHFLDDVIGAIILGFVSLYFFIEAVLWFKKKDIDLFLIVSILLLLGTFFSVFFVIEYLERHYALLLYLAGLFSGYILESRYLKLLAAENIFEKVYKVFLGLVFLFPLSLFMYSDFFSLGVRLFGYFALGLFITLFWPLLFSGIKLVLGKLGR